MSQEETLMDMLYLSPSDEESSGRSKWVPLQLPLDDEESEFEGGAESQPSLVPDLMERFRLSRQGANLRD